jgi:hypothetical protein
MESALRISTNILPGKRIEITAPELPEEGRVDLIVLLPEQPPKTIGILDYIDAMPVRERSADYWAERDRELQADRDSWDR